jgi:dTDP-4-amino-4,6-dideoxygalactose transaminase
MKNPTIYLSDITYDAEEEKAVLDVLRSKWLSMGDITKTFEQEFGEYVNSPYVVAVSNCTAALHLALISLGIGAGDEVIVPSLTFVATANAVCYTGAKPVFADIKSLDDWTISPDSIREHITPRTRAIIVVHYGGYPCDMQAITEIAKKCNLHVVEDAAHGPGSWVDSKHIGTWGDVGCFSFFSNKNMTSGEGGAVVTNSEEIAEKIRNLRSHGMTTISWDRHHGHAYQYDVISLGYNYRFDEIRAALARTQLKKLDFNNRKRSERHAYYRNLLEQFGEVRVPFTHRNDRVSNHLLSILLNENIDRIELMKKMRSYGIQTSIHYPPVHRFSNYRDLDTGSLPYTEIVGKQELTLPLHPLLDFKEIDYIVQKLKECIS